MINGALNCTPAHNCSLTSAVLPGTRVAEGEWGRRGKNETGDEEFQSSPSSPPAINEGTTCDRPRGHPGALAVARQRVRPSLCFPAFLASFFPLFPFYNIREEGNAAMTRGLRRQIYGGGVSSRGCLKRASGSAENGQPGRKVGVRAAMKGKERGDASY